MKKLFILSILLAMIVYNICDDAGAGAGTGADAGTGDGAGTGGATTTTKSACQQKTGSNLAESDCTSLATSNRDKYKCAVKSDKTGCEEVKKETTSSSAASMIKISLFLLISMLFI